jgi:hypothetical protein|tara:strand:+ start:192 stop:377 length:186 start_codon:yes stop_codon:yes gene_type:complete
MKLQEWENLNSIEAGMAFDVDEVIDLLKQAMETSDLLFVERALLIIEGTYENGLDDHQDDE